MRVVFMGVGLVHYIIPVLNRLQSEHGIEVINIVPRSSRGHTQDAVHQTKEGVRFEVCELEEYRVGSLYHSFRGLARFLRARRPDIVVCNDYYLAAFLLHPAVIVTVRLLGIKVILRSIPFQLRRYGEVKECIRGFGLRALVRRVRLEGARFLFKKPDAHLNYVEDAYDIYGSYGVSREKIFVQYNSPDTDMLFKAASEIEGEAPILPPCRHRLIHVGRLVEWKRVDSLIRVLGVIREEFPDAELVVVGEGPQEQACRKLASRLGLESAVRFVGGIYDPKTLGRYFKASTVHVLAGMGGLSINDAMAFGLPVICSVCDGTEKHLIQDGVNGLFFKAGDDGDLADKITRILRDPDAADRMGLRSREVIATKINVYTVIEGYLKAFRYVMETAA